MTARTEFISGRTGRGAAYTSDRSGAAHDKFMRLSAYALAPLGAYAAWALVGVAGKPYAAARAAIGAPFTALSLIAFIIVAMMHARMGAESIIIDYIHDEALKEKALAANRLASVAIASLWTVAILLIAATR